MLIIYIIVIIYSIFLWISYFNKKYTSSSLYFLLSMIWLSVWFLFYFLSYFSTTNIDVLCLYSKITYWISIISIYSFILFIKNYWNKEKKILNTKNYTIFSIFIFILTLYLWTDLFIDGMIYNWIKNHYYENPWILYNLHNIISLISLPIFWFVTYNKFKEISLINRIKLRYILLWIFIFIILSLLFLLILPVFWIRLFERELALFIIPYLIAVSYSINRFHFINLKIWFWKLFIFLMAIFYSWLISHTLKFFYNSFWERFHSFWWLSYAYWTIDLTIWVLIFIFLYNIFDKLFLWNTSLIKFERNIWWLKKSIAYITSIQDLNIFLSNKFDTIFRIKEVKINLYKNKNSSEIYNFFTKDLSRDLFINDVLFIEENKHKFNIEKLNKEIPNSLYLVFPLYNNKNELKGVLEIWKKRFSDSYFTEEIKILKEFSGFIVSHIKYIEIYSDINELNLNLDKKVDEKTIEYNNLINKQKEFISVTSHEIKTPIMASAFQVESIVDDIEDWDITEKELKSELLILKNQIFKITDLAKMLFSVEKYDVDKVSLYIEKIKLKDLFINELSNLQKLNKKLKIDFIFDDENINFLDLDKVQFTQVITNLLNNALKFLNKKSPKIYIEIKSINNYISIDIEDNWNWFKYWEEKEIFKKYTTWSWKTIWLWLWLYLCKKIVEYHWGTIKASNWKHLWWAKFNIFIPKIQNK